MSETVLVNRLYHRELLKRMREIEELEKKWNCKIEFPSTELASDVVTISGPEYQVPQAVDAFLVSEFHALLVNFANPFQGMVPEKHELSFQSSPELRAFLQSPEFTEDVRSKLKNQYEVDATVDLTGDLPTPKDDAASAAPVEDRLVLGYTRNNAGGLRDAIDFLISRLVAHGLDATTVKGAIPRPKSDSFEESLPFFDSKLLQHAPAPIVTDSPARPDDASERGSIFERLRKPGSISSFSSFIGRKNHSASPASFFKHASSNASKASLVSMESRDSGYRNPWNDSGVNLPDDDSLSIHAPVGSSHSHHSSSSTNGGWPVTGRFESKFNNIFGTVPGDRTPKHPNPHAAPDLSRASLDSGRPSTSNSSTGYPAPIGPPR